MNSVPKGARLAADGFFARENGLYARKKLDFLKRYLPLALQATKRKPTRHYVDVFAGPGWNIAKGNETEFEGSPIIAANAREVDGSRPFQTVDAYNIDPWAHAALRSRLASPTACPYTIAHLGNGLTLAEARLRDFERHAYALITLDIENPNQLPWTAIRALRDAAPRSTDGYILLPVGMGIVRMLPYSNELLEPNVESLDSFFGDDSWRTAYKNRTGDGRRKRQETARAVIDTYLIRLRTLWKFATPVCRVTKAGNQMLYYMILVTDHAAGDRLAKWASDDRHNDLQIALI
jgi:three-Cys-motif partner protein